MRQAVAIVETDAVGGIRKARKLLRLARHIRVKAKHLSALCIRLAHDGEWVRANRFRKAFERLSELHDDVREKARLALRQPSSPEPEPEFASATPQLTLKEANQ